MINIDTKLFPECNDCPEIELKLFTEKRYADCVLYCLDALLTCENYDKCKRLRERYLNLKG